MNPVTILKLVFGAVGFGAGVLFSTSVFQEPAVEGQQEVAERPPETLGKPPKEYLSKTLDSQAEIELRNLVSDARALVEAGDIKLALAGIFYTGGKQLQSEVFLTLIAELDKESIAALNVFIMETEEDPVGGDEFEFLDGVNPQLWMELASRWIELDREGFFQFTAGISEEADEWLLFGLGILVRDDPWEALRRIEDLEARLSIDDLESEVWSFLEEIPDLDVPTTLAWLRENAPEFDYSSLIGSGVSEPGKVFEELLLLGDTGQSQNGLAEIFALDELFSQWAKMSPQEALSAAARIENEAMRKDAEDMAIAEWVRRDPVAGMVEAVANGNPLAGVAAWMEFDPQEAVEWAGENLAGDQYGEFIADNLERVPMHLSRDYIDSLSLQERDELGLDEGEFVTSWIAQGEELMALKWLVLQGDSVADLDIGSELAEVIAAGSLTSAAQAGAALPAGKMRDAYLQEVARQAGTSNPAEHAEWIGELIANDSSDYIGSVAQQFYAEWAQEDPESAFRSAEELGTTDGMWAVADGWLEFEDASHVYEWAAPNLDGPAGEGLMQRIVDDWVHCDPAGAAETLLDSESAQRDYGVSRLFNRWGWHSPDEAAQFIGDRYEPGPERDDALDALVFGVFSSQMYDRVTRGETPPFSHEQLRAQYEASWETP